MTRKSRGSCHASQENNTSSEKYPTRDHYPLTRRSFEKPEAFVSGLPSLFCRGEWERKIHPDQGDAHRCYIHIWRDTTGCTWTEPYEEHLYRYISAEWNDGEVPGSFFSSDLFAHFAQNLDEWAASDPEMLRYFGGKSLVAVSRPVLMSYFRSRYQLRASTFLMNRRRLCPQDPD